MDRLPSNIIFDIFSRVPVKRLAQSRCVSKAWCKYIDDRYLVVIHDGKRVEEPTPFVYHQHFYFKKLSPSICFHVIESKQRANRNYVLEAKEGPHVEFLPTKPRYESFIVTVEVRGFCRGLICLSQNVGHVITSLVVIHPQRKECYELPPFPLHFPLCLEKQMFRESCGLGFDASTNAMKMVCVKKHSTLVHVFGTNSWREIAQVPVYPITGKPVFANGCLHWLVSDLDIKNEESGTPIIWFDVEKEEFGLIDPPKRMIYPPKRMCNTWSDYRSFYNQVVDLNGEVGYVCCRTMEVWVLNKQKEWAPHCRVEKETVPDGYVEVIGCWNKDGDILLKYIPWGDGIVRYIFFVYNLKSGVLHKTNVTGREDGTSPRIIMYRNALSSIHRVNTNSVPMEKTKLKKSCREILSLF